MKKKIVVLQKGADVSRMLSMSCCKPGSSKVASGKTQM